MAFDIEKRRKRNYAHSGSRASRGYRHELQERRDLERAGWRAVRETATAPQVHWRTFWCLSALIGVIYAIEVFAFSANGHHTITDRSLVAALGIVAGPVGALILLLFGFLLYAPYMQRDEARAFRELWLTGGRIAMVGGAELRKTLEDALKNAAAIRGRLAQCETRGDVLTLSKECREWANRVGSYYRQLFPAFSADWEEDNGVKFERFKPEEFNRETVEALLDSQTKTINRTLELLSAEA